MPHPRKRVRAIPLARLAATSPTLTLAAALLAGCAADLGSLGAPSPLPYQHSNALGAPGYSESLIGPDRYRIAVKGPAGTPRDRLEKIAATRAAEIGTEIKRAYFKIESVAHATNCEQVTPPRQRGGVSAGKTRQIQYAMLTADVSYANSQPDPGFLPSRSSFAQYRAELAQDTAPPAPIDPAAPVQCG